MNPPDTGKLVLSILRGQELKMTSDNTGVIKLSAVGPTNIEGAAKMSNLLLLLLGSGSCSMDLTLMIFGIIHE